MLNLAMALENAARKYPSRTAFIQGAARLSYAEVDRQANALAQALKAAGVRPNDKIALTCPNLLQFPVCYYGILKAGAVVVPLNVMLKTDEIAYHLQDCEARIYLCFEGTAELPMARMGHEAFEKTTSCERMIVITCDNRPSPIAGVATLDEFVAGFNAEHELVARDAGDTAVILYTSGTTGKSKGAELSHSNMVLNAFVSRDLGIKVLNPAQVQTLLIVLPLFHSFGQTVLMNAGVLAANTIVLVPRFDPAAVLELFASEQVTYFAGVPTMYWGLLNAARAQNIDARTKAASLKMCSSGGAAMPPELLRAFEETFGVIILEGYGLSETSPVATFNVTDLPRKVGSIGLPVFACDVRVVDENMNDVPVNTPGEIVIRGHNIMKGYYRKPEATAEAMRGGWFHTGDVARKDEEGYFFIVDRLKDMVVRGGFNVYPREIEDVLMQHPAVSMAAVLGVPNDELGEEVKACVIRKPGVEVTEQELVGWCRERLAAYKYPRIVEFRDSFPMTATGKILKREMRAHASAAAT